MRLTRSIAAVALVISLVGSSVPAHPLGRPYSPRFNVSHFEHNALIEATVTSPFFHDWNLLKTVSDAARPIKRLVRRALLITGGPTLGIGGFGGVLPDVTVTAKTVDANIAQELKGYKTALRTALATSNLAPHYTVSLGVYSDARWDKKTQTLHITVGRSSITNASVVSDVALTLKRLASVPLWPSQPPDIEQKETARQVVALLSEPVPGRLTNTWSTILEDLEFLAGTLGSTAWYAESVQKQEGLFGNTPIHQWTEQQQSAFAGYLTDYFNQAFLIYGGFFMYVNRTHGLDFAKVHSWSQQSYKDRNTLFLDLISPSDDLIPKTASARTYRSYVLLDSWRLDPEPVIDLHNNGAPGARLLSNWSLEEMQHAWSSTVLSEEWLHRRDMLRFQELPAPQQSIDSLIHSVFDLDHETSPYVRAVANALRGVAAHSQMDLERLLLIATEAHALAAHITEAPATVAQQYHLLRLMMYSRYPGNGDIDIATEVALESLIVWLDMQLGLDGRLEDLERSEAMTWIESIDPQDFWNLMLPNPVRPQSLPALPTIGQRQNQMPILIEGASDRSNLKIKKWYAVDWPAKKLDEGLQEGLSFFDLHSEELLSIFGHQAQLDALGIVIEGRERIHTSHRAYALEPKPGDATKRIYEIIPEPSDPEASIYFDVSTELTSENWLAHTNAVPGLAVAESTIALIKEALSYTRNPKTGKPYKISDLWEAMEATCPYDTAHRAYPPNLVVHFRDHDRAGEMKPYKGAIQNGATDNWRGKYGYQITINRHLPKNLRLLTMIKELENILAEPEARQGIDQETITLPRAIPSWLRVAGIHGLADAVKSVSGGVALLRQVILPIYRRMVTQLVIFKSFDTQAQWATDNTEWITGLVQKFVNKNRDTIFKGGRQNLMGIPMDEATRGVANHQPSGFSRFLHSAYLEGALLVASIGALFIAVQSHPDLLTLRGITLLAGIGIVLTAKNMWSRNVKGFLFSGGILSVAITAIGQLLRFKAAVLHEVWKGMPGVKDLLHNPDYFDPLIADHLYMVHFKHISAFNLDVFHSVGLIAIMLPIAITMFTGIFGAQRILIARQNKQKPTMLDLTNFYASVVFFTTALLSDKLSRTVPGLPNDYFLWLLAPPNNTPIFNIPDTLAIIVSVPAMLITTSRYFLRKVAQRQQHQALSFA